MIHRIKRLLFSGWNGAYLGTYLCIFFSLESETLAHCPEAWETTQSGSIYTYHVCLVAGTSGPGLHLEMWIGDVLDRALPVLAMSRQTYVILRVTTTTLLQYTAHNVMGG